MEHLVLKVLSFDLAAPTINQFLTQYFLHQSVGKQVENLAMVRFQQCCIQHSVYREQMQNVTQLNWTFSILASSVWLIRIPS